MLKEMGLNQIQSTNLQVRMTLLRHISFYIKSMKISQAEVANLLGTTQPRVSQIINGNVGLFSVDILMNILSRLGIEITIKCRYPTEKNVAEVFNFTRN